MSIFDINNSIAHLSIDCVIFGYKDGELKVLITQYKFGKELWGLPGGYVLKTESIDQAASRILKERTNLDQIYLEQFRVFGEKDRIEGSEFKKELKAVLHQFDPDLFNKELIEWITSRFVSIGYYALVNIDKVQPQTGELEARLEWRNINELPKMIHDHNHIIAFAHEALRINLDKRLIGFQLLPDTFTMKEVKELYEAVFGQEFPMNNFQKKILSLKVLDRMGKKFTGAQNRAPYLYRFIKE